MVCEQELLHELSQARRNGIAASARLVRAMQQLADGYLAAHRPAEARPWCEELCRELDRSSATSSDDLAQARVRLAIACQALGDLTAAESAILAAIAIYQQMPDPPVLDFAAALSDAAELFFAQGRYESARQASREASALLTGVLPEHHPERVRIRNNLGALHVVRGELLLAERLFRRNLCAAEDALGYYDPGLVTHLHNLADVLRRRGRGDEAEPLLLRSLNLARSAFGMQHTHTAHALGQLAELCLDRGSWTAAVRLWQQVLEIRRAILPADHPQIARTLRTLGESLLRLGKAAEAEPLFDEAKRICERVFGPQHPQVASLMGNLGRACLAQGRLANAERLTREALLLQQESLATDDPVIGLTHRLLAQIALARRDFATASEQIHRSLRLLEQRPKDADELAQSCLVWAEVELGRESAAAALSALDRAAELLQRARGTHPELHTVFRLRASAALLEQDLPRAEQEALTAHRLANALPERTVAETADLAAVFSDLYSQQRRWHEAESLAEQELSLRERQYHSEHAGLLPALRKLADARLAMDQPAAAEAPLMRALAIAERTHGTKHPQVAVYVERLARVNLMLRRLDAFRAWMQRAVQLMDDEDGTAAAEPTVQLESCVELLRAAGEHAEADRWSEHFAAERERHAHVLF